MALESGSCGYMLQGVSQQAQQVQPEGHVVESINMLPDPNEGNTRRPGSELMQVGTLPTTTAKSQTILLQGAKVRMSFDVGVLSMVGYDGTVYTIQDPNGYIPGYVNNTNMKFLAREDEVIVLNRNRIVGSTNDDSGLIKTWGYCFCLGGQYQTEYRLRIRYSDGTVALGTVTTPDSDPPGNETYLRAEYIIEQLKLSIEADPDFKASTTILWRDEVLFITDNVVAGYTIDSADGRGDTLLRSGKARADTFADVPRYARHKSVIKVQGERGTLADDVWLMFLSDTEVTVGEGFGTAGIWTETYDPNSATLLNRDSMPHILTPHETLPNTYVFARGNWTRRPSGTDVSNPLPSFVGKRIRDVGEFQSRIWLCAGGYWCASRVDEPTSFWRRSVTVLLATDVIDIKCNDANDVELQHGVDYDKNLIFTSRNGQYIVAGNGSIGPNTASIVKATNFETSVTARPTVAGQNFMMPHVSTIYGGVNEMQPSQNAGANYVDSLNKVTSKYIIGEPREMVSSANANILVLYTAEDPRTLYVYNFLWEGNEKTQSAWHKWTFRDDIHHIHMESGVLYVWIRSGTTINCLELRVDKPVDDVGFHVQLDYKLNYTVPTPSMQLTLNRNDYKFVARTATGEYKKGMQVTPEIETLGSNSFRYTFPPEAPLNLLGGRPFESELRPTKPVPKDWRGNKRNSAQTVVHKYMIDYVDSGEFSVYMDSPYEGLVPISTEEDFAMEGTVYANEFGMRTGTLEVPWGEDASIGALVIKATSVRPVTLVEPRWYGNVYEGRK